MAVDPDRGNVTRIWARAILAVAALLARADGLLRHREVRADRASLERLVDRLRVENELLRARLKRLPPIHRPRYTSWQRLRILWHKVRYGLSQRATARIFVIEPSTIMRWVRAVEKGGHALIRGLAPVNRLPDLVRELTHLLRFDQPRWGTRRIAQVLARLGVHVSRSSVQRIVRAKPRRPREATAALKRRLRGLQARMPHHVWLLDFTTVKVLFGLLEIRVGAVFDAFSRSVLAIGVARKEPTAAWTCDLLRRALRTAARSPRWIVTDQGEQFVSEEFSRLLRVRKIRRRFGAVRSSRSVAPIERLWLTLKTEWSVAVLALWLVPARTQRSVEAWAEWYNRHRPHQGLGGRTPEEVVRERPRVLRLVDERKPWALECEHFAGDRMLPVYRLRRAA